MPVGDDGMPWEFRHKAAFVFGDGPRGLVMGHYAAGGRDIVPVSECPVHGARANRIAFRLHEALARARVPAAGPRLDGVLRHVIVRTSADERDAVALLVVTRNDPVAAQAGARAAGVGRSPRRVLPEHPRPAVVVHGRPHDDPPRGPRARPRAANRADVPGFPDRVLPDQPGGRRGPRRPRPGAGRRRAAAGPRPLCRQRPLQPAAGDARPRGDRGRGEPSGDGRRRPQSGREPARRTTRCGWWRLASKTRCRDWRGGRWTWWCSIRRGRAARRRSIDAVFGRIAPPRAIYVSCNPEALAAELPAILGHGYRAVSLTPVDMFPHTPHIETVAVFERVAGSHVAPRRERRCARPAAECQNEAPPMTTA